jgi:hypothetical protein
MAFNGSGTFSRLYSWIQDAANLIKISSTRMDAETDGIATGLSTCITKDGQTTVTANIPLGAFRITNLGAATARLDAAQTAQVQNSTFQIAGSVSGTNTITASMTPVLTAYVIGQCFRFMPANTNTGAATINLDGVGALTIKKAAAGALVALSAGDIVASIPAYFILSDTSTAVLLNPQSLAHLNINQSFTKAQGVTRVALTDAATVAVDASLSNVFTLTLGGNRTLGQPTNPKDGQGLTIFITQDGTGSRTLVYHADWLFPGGVDPTLSTAIGAEDVLSAVYNGATTKWYAVLNKAFA